MFTQNKHLELKRSKFPAAYSFIQLTHVQEYTLTLTGIFRPAILRRITIVVKVKKKQQVEELRINNHLISNEVCQWLFWCVKAENLNGTFKKQLVLNEWREKIEQMNSDEKLDDYFHNNVNST